jgi:hypothetical protein
MSQFLTAPNAIQPHDGTDYRADAIGVMTVPDELDLVFRNAYGLASWAPAPADVAESAKPAKSLKLPVAEEPKAEA